MRESTVSEWARIARLRSVFGEVSGPILTGIGDDAAVLVSDGTLVWTVDAQVEGTHFDRRWLSWRDVGWRSLMAAASDVTAMGAIPLAVLSALVLPGDMEERDFDALIEGQAEASRAVGAAIIGGNLARGRDVSVTTTLLGRCGKALLRSGAAPGDGVYLAGAVGLAAAGLRALQQGRGDPQLASAVHAWRRPRPPLERVTALSAASAAVDVSDGLAADLGHLAEASAVTVMLDGEAIVASTGAALRGAANALGCDPLELALYGGEDYALVACSPVPLSGFHRIGSVLARSPEGPVLLANAGGAEPIVRKGFDHFGIG